MADATNDDRALLPNPETAAFLLPGLLHQFGNHLLTIQGNALQLPDADEERRREAILAAVQRGTASLQVMRVLMGERTGAAANPGELLRQLAELARVPVRERGFTLEWRDEPAESSAWVSADGFVAAVAEALRRWLDAIPPGAQGAVTLALCPGVGGGATGGCEVRVGLELAAGSLPFPLAVEHVAAALGELCAAAGLQVSCGAEERCLRLAFLPASLSVDPQA